MEPKEPELKRVVLNLTFEDPHVIKAELEQTWYNPNESDGVRMIELAKQEHPYFSNLSVYDRQRRRLEIISSGNTRKPNAIIVDTIDPVKPHEYYSVYSEYFLSYDRLPLKPTLLFEKPVYSFPLPLGDFTRYLTVKPPPKILIKLDSKGTFLSDLMPHTIIDSPPKRNAVFVRFGRLNITKDLETQFLRQRLQKIQLKSTVELIDGQTYVKVRTAVLIRIAESLPGPIKSQISRSRLAKLLRHHISIKEERLYKREDAKRKEATVAVSLHIPGSLRAWFWTVFLFGLIIGLISPSMVASASMVTLLAVTRSWLFYEERMMRNAGVAFVGLAALNLIGFLVLAYTCLPNSTCKPLVEFLPGVSLAKIGADLSRYLELVSLVLRLLVGRLLGRFLGL